MIMVTVALEGRSAQGLFQERAFTSKNGKVAIIQKLVNLNTNAIYVGLSPMEPFFAQKLEEKYSKIRRTHYSHKKDDF